jgi:hypothetical protein
VVDVLPPHVQRYPNYWLYPCYQHSKENTKHGLS